MLKIYPVIHHLNDQLAMEQAQIAATSGADGLFLISHHGDDDLLAPLAACIQNKFSIPVGINYLSKSVQLAAEDVMTYGLSMLWADRCGVSSESIDYTANEVKNIVSAKLEIEVFASVAFKYQSKERNPKLAADNARSLGFIPTTSGQATGHAPDVQKVIDMQPQPLAIASGMTVDNVAQFAPYLSHILVATGVALDEHRFDERKLQSFIDVVRK